MGAQPLPFICTGSHPPHSHSFSLPLSDPKPNPSINAATFTSSTPTTSILGIRDDEVVDPPICSGAAVDPSVHGFLDNEMADSPIRGIPTVHPSICDFVMAWWQIPHLRWYIQASSASRTIHSSILGFRDAAVADLSIRVGPTVRLSIHSFRNGAVADPRIHGGTSVHPRLP